LHISFELNIFFVIFFSITEKKQPKLSAFLTFYRRHGFDTNLGNIYKFFICYLLFFTELLYLSYLISSQAEY